MLSPSEHHQAVSHSRDDFWWDASQKSLMGSAEKSCTVTDAKNRTKQKHRTKINVLSANGVEAWELWNINTAKLGLIQLNVISLAILLRPLFMWTIWGQSWCSNKTESSSCHWTSSAIICTAIYSSFFKKFNQNGNSGTVPGFKQKQPLTDCVHALKGHDCTWSSRLSERNSAQNQRIVWCPLRPQLPQVVCLTTKQKLKAKQWGVTFVGEAQRSQNPLLTVSLFCSGNTFFFFLHRDEGGPCNLTPGSHT